MTTINKMRFLLDAVSREFTVAELKGVINLFLIPTALTVITLNIFGAIFYIGLCFTIYNTTEKGTENARVFKLLASYTAVAVSFVALLGFGFIIL